jgi:hypothetical protein
MRHLNQLPKSTNLQKDQVLRIGITKDGFVVLLYDVLQLEYTDVDRSSHQEGDRMAFDKVPKITVVIGFMIIAK